MEELSIDVLYFILYSALLLVISINGILSCRLGRIKAKRLKKLNERKHKSNGRNSD